MCDKSRAITSDQKLRAALDTHMSKGMQWPSLLSLRPVVIQSKGLSLAIVHPKKAAMAAQCCAAIV
jgi:hypothetical protein